MNSPFDILLQPSKKENTHLSKVILIEKFGHYSIGQAKRPNIQHDNGFLDKFPSREPTLVERANLVKWKTMLEGSEALCTNKTGNYIEKCGGDLVDANAAYRHFLYGNGKDRSLDYERYIQNDSSGQSLIKTVLAEFQLDVERIGKDRLKFSVVSEPYKIDINSDLPYPATTNWQKTIGAHYIWVSADVTVSVNAEKRIVYDAHLIIHMEDKYNFNPGSKDIKTKIADKENGVFEITGLAKQYMNFGVANRHITWVDGARANTPK